MTTINAVNNGLSGSTGTGSFVGATSPALVTPTIQGVTDASSAASGIVGELISSNVPIASAVSLTNNTEANVTSISLTAGDWDVYGNVRFQGSVVTSVAYSCWTSTTSATRPDGSLTNVTAPAPFTSQNVQFSSDTPYLRVNVSSTTTVYLSAFALFSAGTSTACGSIFARRVR